MKRAFTLIELLVVIAVIAILAAILFPVFAQAKIAAKKTVSISNQKQIGLGFMMYLGDNEDIYPRRSGYEPNSSLNPEYRSVTADGTHTIVNWQSWQKYVLPYVKNYDLFFHPMREKSASFWKQGLIVNSYALNIGITGNTASGLDAVPWTGGSQTGIPLPSSTMLLLELPLSQVLPWTTNGDAYKDNGTVANPKVNVVYPAAIKEYWQHQLYKATDTKYCNLTEEVDPVAAPGGGLVVGNADGSARFITAAKMVGLTPTAQEYIGTSFPFSNWQTSNCRNGGNAGSSSNKILYPSGFASPNMALNYPFWGLGSS